MGVRQVMVRRVGWPFGRSIDLDPSRTTWTIGRDGACRIALDDSAASRRHAALERRDGGLVVRDLSSANGVWQGGSRVAECTVGPGDRLVVGRTEVYFRGPIQVWTARLWPVVAGLAVAVVVLLLREAVVAPPRAPAGLVEAAALAAIEPEPARAKDLAELVGLHNGSAGLAVPLARLIDAGDPLDPAVSLDDWLARARTLVQNPALDDGARATVERRAEWLAHEGRQVRELRSAERELVAGAHASAFARFDRARALIPDAPAVPWFTARFDAERARLAALALAQATALADAGRHDEALVALGTATDAGAAALRGRIERERAHAALAARAGDLARAGDVTAACAAWQELARDATGEPQRRALASLAEVRERVQWRDAEEAYARGDAALAARLLGRSWGDGRAAPARALAAKVEVVARILERAQGGADETALAALAAELAAVEPDGRHPARLALLERVERARTERTARAAELVLEGARELAVGRLVETHAAWQAAVAADRAQRSRIEALLAARAEALFNPAWRRRHGGERTPADAALWPLLAEFLPAGHGLREKAARYAKP